MSDQATIENLLASRGARFKGPGGDTAGALERRDLTRLICEDYPTFETLRNAILASRSGVDVDDVAASGGVVRLLTAMLDLGLLERKGRQLAARKSRAKRYLSGSWLEELAWHVSLEAGACEAVFSQELSWQVDDFYGENEIDLIARSGNRLGFVSCKALQSRFRSSNAKLRNRLMDAVHEANNLVDHFGVPGEKSAVLVTSDLFDDDDGSARYTALMGKAAILQVRVIPLEEFGWSQLAEAMKEVMQVPEVVAPGEAHQLAGSDR